MKRLEGKTALITGAARGIGLAFAVAFVREGARVAIADINMERARQSAAELGSAAIAVEMDVSRQNSIDQGVSRPRIRRTVATNMRAIGIDRLTVSKVLNHSESGVTRVYDRYAGDREKTQALARWGEELRRIIEARDDGKVVALRG